MSDELMFTYTVDGEDFTRAGEASSNVKNKLKMLGVGSDVIRKVAIAMYEGEINMVIHAEGGMITVTVSDDDITMVLADKGPGIPDIEKAMQPMFTTKPELERSGMGFAFMEAFMDGLEVESAPGQGTTVKMKKIIGKGRAGWTIQPN